MLHPTSLIAAILGPRRVEQRQPDRRDRRQRHHSRRDGGFHCSDGQRHSGRREGRRGLERNRVSMSLDPYSSSWDERQVIPALPHTQVFTTRFTFFLLFPLSLFHRYVGQMSAGFKRWPT